MKLWAFHSTPKTSPAAAWALSLLLIAGSVLFLVTLHGQPPDLASVTGRYLRVWLAAALWVAAMLSVGRTLSRPLCDVSWPWAEKLVFAAAAGTVAFFLFTFAAGLAGLLGVTWSLATPALFLGIGATGLFREVNRTYRAFHLPLGGRAAPSAVQFPSKLQSQRRRPQAFVATCARRGLGTIGALGVVLLVFPTLNPGNIGFDARWYHLPIAEHYVASGAIRPFSEGWYLGTYPQLASILDVWAYALPGLSLTERILLCAQLEVALFLFTLLGVAVMTRRLVPEQRASTAVQMSWGSMLLFPGIFVYDSNLWGGADHVLAFWGAPIFLALLRCMARATRGSFILLAIALSGAALTKLQAGCVVVPPAFVLCLHTAFARRSDDVRSTPPKSVFRSHLSRRGALLVGLAVFATLTMPHWLKNWMWYGDPSYPFLWKWFSLRPWTPDAGSRFQKAYDSLVFGGGQSTLARIRQAIEALATFSFTPHDWFWRHGRMPIFGSLFTLLIVSLPFIGARRRVWLLTGLTLFGLFIWSFAGPQDRYLQCLLPWMAAVTGALLALLFSSPWPPVRFATLAVLLLQIAWCVRVPLIPSKASEFMPEKVTAPRSALVDTIELFDPTRPPVPGPSPFSPWPELAAVLPRPSHILLHETFAHAGLLLPSLTDLSGAQGGIQYGALPNRAAVHALLRRLGVSHVAWSTANSRGFDTLGGDIRFFDFAVHGLVHPRAIELTTVAELPRTAPASDALDNPLVAIFACDIQEYPMGLYAVSTLDRLLPARTKAVPDLPLRSGDGVVESRATWIAEEPRCHRSPQEGWAKLFDRGNLTVYERSAQVPLP